MWGMQVRYARAASNGRSQGDESGATGQHWAVDGQELTDTLQEKNEKTNTEISRDGSDQDQKKKTRQEIFTVCVWLA